MNTPKKYPEEFPNISYIKELGKADIDFERKFIATLEREFTEQLGNYLYHIKNNEPRAAAEMVRKIKFKFTVLSMNNAFDFAEFYEERLRVGDMSLADDFRLILKKVDTFLKTL